LCILLCAAAFVLKPCHEEAAKKHVKAHEDAMAYSLLLINLRQKSFINGSLNNTFYTAFISFLAILLFFSRTVPGITAPFRCPDGCDCDHINDKVDCTGRGIAYLNQNLSVSTRVLLCGDNAFKAISKENINLTHLRKLRKLSFANNEITIVRTGAFRGLEKISFLDLSRNNLRSIPSDIRLLRSLNTLKLDENAIQRIYRDEFHPESKLEALSMAHNNLEILESDTFTNLQSLLYINLQNNSISNVSRSVFTVNEFLIEMDMSWNQLGFYDPELHISDWFQLPALNLNRLSISHNMIQGFNKGAFDLLTELKKLEIQSNEISQLNHDVFQNLHSLEILLSSDNQISSLPVQLLKGSLDVHTVDFSNNFISDVPAGIFSTNEALETINFSGNDLSDIDWVVHTSSTLRELYLSDNVISSLPDITFKFCVNMEILEMQNNALTEFPKLMNMTNLETLDLTNNQISVVPRDTRFVQYQHLTFISLAWNRLVTLEEDIFNSLPPVETFDVAENPFKCDCHLLWMDDIYAALWNGEEVPPNLETWLPTTFESMVCDQPKGFRGESVARLAENRNNFMCSSFASRRGVIGLILGWLILLLTIVGVYWRWKIKKARRHMRAWKTKRRKKRFKDRLTKRVQSDEDRVDSNRSNGRVKMYSPSQHEYISQFDRDSYHSVANPGEKTFSPACVCLLQHDDSMQSCDLLSETTV
ncbi:leucine-rich repeat-containing G-protein coupled receptor 5-like, partial [Lytechinus variegatus]|uniref:leucine-rich repeat-containing G-protein coupled receptor 5-like n=1 Tax=Lytechinus variegatus TaxID=7654 RepID=UPI001BB10B5A